MTSQEWESILDKMIYAMDMIANGDTDLNHQAVAEGCELFGKWFQHLWT